MTHVDLVSENIWVLSSPPC